MKTKKRQIEPQESESREVDNVPLRDTPTADWSVEELAAYARGCMAEADELEEKALGFGRRSVQEFWRAGQALKLIADRLKPEKQWVGWQETCGLSRNRINLAIRLAKKAKSLDDLKDFDTIREALVHHGIEKPRQPALAKPPADPPQKRDAEGDVKGGHEDDEDQNQAAAPKGDEQSPTPPQDPRVPCVQGELRVERNGQRTSIVLDAGKVRVDRLLPFKCDVRIVARWRVELRGVIDNGEAVLILPGMEVPEDAR